MQRSFDATAVPPPLREMRSLPFSFQKSLSLSEWPFTVGPFAKRLSPQQSSSNQCEQSGQMIFRNDLLSNSSQFTFLCPESPGGAIQAAGSPRSSQLAALSATSNRVYDGVCSLLSASASHCQVHSVPFSVGDLITF